MSKLVCLVGMCGAGKSEVAQIMMQNRKFEFVRFGQITLDEVIKRGQKTSEKLEREIREGFRKKYGMAAFAILNIPKFDKGLRQGDVIGDGLYSWEEYIELKNKYAKRLVVVAVYAPPKMRYERLEGRSKKHGEDKDLRFRSFTKKEAAERDKAEIENIHKAGPIAMADYTIINTGTIRDLRAQTKKILKEIFG